MAAGRLGCADNIEVFITERCSRNPKRGKRVCTLTNVSSVVWNRILDGVSEAEVEVPLGVGTGGGVNPCCGCMGIIEPWCHELNIARDGVPVWIGPVTEVDYRFNTVTIRAQDLLGWLGVRVPTISLGSFGAPGQLFELTDLAVDLLEAAFSEDDPCVLDNIYQADLNNRPTYIGPVAAPPDSFPTFQGTYLDWMQTLSDMGLDWTVVGRTIVLSVDSSDLPVAGFITDEHILGEVSVKKDGSQTVNRVYARYTGDDNAEQCANNAAAGLTPFNSVPCPALVEGNMYCYGPIERVVEDASGSDFASTIGVARQIAEKYIREGSITPRIVEIPSGSKLSPDTPFDINELIPGVRVRIAIAGLCFEVNDVFKLLEVTYSIGDDGNEEIGATFGPVDKEIQGGGGTI